jgi:hypothetical protein
MVVTKTARGETRDKKSVGEASKPMTMGSWIHELFIVTIDQTNLDQRFLLALEGLPWVDDVAKC